MKHIFSKFHKQNRAGRWAVLIVLCLIAGTFFAPFSILKETVYAENKVVRVGVYEKSGLMDYENGTCTGIVADMLDRTCSYTNWTIEYVECLNQADAVTKLQTDQIDLIPAVQKSDILPEGLLYADIASGYTYNTLMCLKASTLQFEDFTNFDGIKIAIAEDYLAKNALIEYLQENQVENYSLLIYDSVEEAKAAVNNRTADVLAADFLEITDAYRAIGYFEPRPFFYVTTEEKSALAEEMMSALTQLNIDYPGYLNGLVSDYYDKMTQDVTLLTPDEKAYIEDMGKNQKTLRVGYVDDEFPFSYVENGEFVGMARDVLDEYQDNTGIKLQYINVGDTDTGVKMLQNGEIDILSYFSDLEKSPNELGIRYAKCYAHNYYSMIIKESEKEDQIETVAITPEYLRESDDFLDADNTTDDFTFIEYNSVSDCLDAVQKGDADACIASTYLLQKARYTKYKYQDLVISGTVGNEDNVYFVISHDADESLFGTLKKLTDTVDSVAANQYIVTHISQERYVMFRVLGGALVAFALAVILTIFFVRQYGNARKVRNLTSIDAELGIWNASFFTYHAVEHVKKLPKKHFAIVYLYLSQFRTYSTINGYEESHKILEAVLKCLTEECLNPETEHYGRGYGGRFILLLETEGEEELTKRLDNIRRLISDNIYAIDPSPNPICFGAAFVDQWDHNVEKAIEHANMAMDSLKNSDVGKTAIFDESFNTKLMDRYEREKNLDMASLKSDFVVYYQSKVDIRSEQIVGAEALVRFKDPNDGGKIKSPAYFIDYFEHTGRIRKLDFFVLNEVCRLLKRRLDDDLPVVPISCNFSRLHFTDPRFVTQVELVVDSYDIPRNLIEIEVTETAVVENFSEGVAVECMDLLVEKGFALSVDDFGTGYSSLGILEQIPASVIKLDRSFFRNEKDRARKIKILQKFVEMARNLDVSIVCEGVEFDEDIDLMNQIKAYIAQGYRFSKPEPSEDFEKRLR